MEYFLRTRPGHYNKRDLQQSIYNILLSLEEIPTPPAVKSLLVDPLFFFSFALRTVKDFVQQLAFMVM